MLGSYLSAAYETTPMPAEARTLDSGRDTLVFVFNHNKQAADANVRLRIAPGAFQASGLIAGQPLELTRHGGLLLLNKRLDAGVWVVRIVRP